MVLLWILLVIAALIVIVYVGGGILTAELTANRKRDLAAIFPQPRTPEQQATAERLKQCARDLEAQVTREYEIINREGLKLHGYLVQAPRPSDVYVFCAHGFHSHHRGFEFGEYAPMWQERGYNLFLVDHRAHGKSEGNYLSFGQHESEDCMEWLDFLKKEFGPDIRIILHGQSMGCNTILLMAGRPDFPDNVKMMVADCGYTDFYHITLYSMRFPVFVKVPMTKLANVYLRLFHHVNLHASDALAAVRHTRVPILFFHGGKDTVVPSYMSEQFCEACGSEVKQLIIFPEAGHAKSHTCCPEEYKRAVDDFADRFLGPAEPAGEPGSRPGSAEPREHAGTQES